MTSEVPTRAEVTDVEIPGLGTLVLLTLDNGTQGRVPVTLGPLGLDHLRSTLEAQRDRARSGEIAALAVTGGHGVFAAGADLRVAAEITTPAAARALAELGHATLRLLGDLGVPTLAVVNGTALGGGLELALHCTYRVVADDVVRLALPETHLGLVPGWGGCFLAPRLLGIEQAVGLMVDRPLAGNRMTDAGAALASGLVDAVLPADRLRDAAWAWLAAVMHGEIRIERRPLDPAEEWRDAVDAAKSRVDARWHGAKTAPYRALDLLAAARDADVETAFAAEDDALVELLLSDQFRAGLYAAELIRRGARSPAGAPDPGLARPVTAVGIVGAGLMASQLGVLVAHRLGVPVVLRDLDAERVAAGEAAVTDLVTALHARGRIEDPEQLLGRIEVTTDLAAVAGADLVIEAVTEVLAVKQRVFAEVEALVSPTTVLATNTSALSVTAMSAQLEHPERVVGLHFFNPVAQMPLVEVVRTEHADDAALATAFTVAQALGKTAVAVADRPGFVVNRLLLRLLADVAAGAEAGVPVEAVDASLDPLGLPMRPFALLDLVGLPVALHVLDTLHTELGPRYPLSPGLERLRDEGNRLSREDGSVEPQIESAFGAPRGGSGDQVRDRVLRGLTEEIGLLLAEGVVADVRQVDLAMLLGAGWPVHLGGIAPYLDREGYSGQILGRRLLPPGVADLDQG